MNHKEEAKLHFNKKNFIAAVYHSREFLKDHKNTEIAKIERRSVKSLQKEENKITVSQNANEIHYEDWEKYIRDNGDERALIYFKECKNNDLHDIEGFCYIGDCTVRMAKKAEQQNNKKAAKSCYKEALGYYEIAVRNKYLDAKKYYDKEHGYKKHIMPNNFDICVTANYGRGVCNMRLKNYKAAIRDLYLTKYLDQDQDLTFNPAQLLNQCYKKLKMNKEEIEKFEISIRTESFNFGGMKPPSPDDDRTIN